MLVHCRGGKGAAPADPQVRKLGRRCENIAAAMKNSAGAKIAEYLNLKLRSFTTNRFLGARELRLGQFLLRFSHNISGYIFPNLF